MVEPDDKALRSVKQIAAAAGVSEGFIRKEIDGGRLKTIRLGRLIRISPESWAEYLAQNGQAKGELPDAAS